MAEIPSSWGLKKRKRSDGKLDILGKTDAGEEYRVRTTSGPDITEGDIRELAAVDREQTTAREFVQRTIAHQKQINDQRDSQMESDFAAAAEEIVRASTTDGRATRAGQLDLPGKYGMSSAYAKGRRYWLGQLAGCKDPARRKEIMAALEN